MDPKQEAHKKLIKINDNILFIVSNINIKYKIKKIEARKYSFVYFRFNHFVQKNDFQKQLQLLLERIETLEKE